MIKGISSGGRYMQVMGGQASSTYVNGYGGAQGVGNMRFNTTNQNMEVFDGNNWQMLGNSFATVQLTAEAEDLLDWARQKRNEEISMKALADKHPAVAIALENLRKAEEQLKATVILSKDYETNEETAS